MALPNRPGCPTKMRLEKMERSSVILNSVHERVLTIHFKKEEDMKIFIFVLSYFKNTLRLDFHPNHPYFDFKLIFKAFMSIFGSQNISRFLNFRHFPIFFKIPNSKSA